MGTLINNIWPCLLATGILGYFLRHFLGDKSKALLANLTSERDNLQISLNTAQKQSGTFKAELDPLKGKLSGLTADIETRNGELSNLQRELDTLKAANAKLTSDLEVCATKSTALTAERDSLSAQLQAHTSALTEANARIQQAGAQLTAQTGELEQLKAQLVAAPASAASTGLNLGAAAMGLGGAALGLVAGSVAKAEPPVARETPSHSDDLKDIVGVGPVLEGRLHERGIRTFQSVAHLAEAQQSEIGETIGFPGRVEREGWVPQAYELHFQKYGQRLVGDPLTGAAILAAAQSGTTLATENLLLPGTPLLAVLEGNEDDLKDIVGVGPVLESRLQEQGIRTFRQVALLSPEALEFLNSKLDFPGRIEREQWVAQSYELHFLKYGQRLAGDPLTGAAILQGAQSGTSVA
jgi:predicted flap endonuclease-1-like 5' DNA nuclease